MTTVLEAARREFSLGHVPIAVPRGTKIPTAAGWQKSHPSAADLPRLFANGANLGVLLGEPSGGLTDIDLDAAEARGCADALLPRTGSVFGRRSTPRSHRRYYADPLEPTRKFVDPTRPDEEGMLVEIRSTGAQTIHPPSLHPSGELYAWEQDGPPERVDGRVLRQCVEKVASAALLARHWPAVGGRHDAALALAGALLRADWEEEDAVEFVRAVARAAGDEEAEDRVRCVSTTARRIAGLDGRTEATGYTRLAELVDERAARRVKEWLGLPDERWPLRLGGRLISGPEEEAPADPFGWSPVPDKPWPEPMGQAAFRGLAGEIVGALEPYTEADPHALLVSLLTALGCEVNAGPHLMVGATVHTPRLFPLLLGRSSWARKGTSWDPVRAIVAAADPGFLACIQGGLSSGEGLIAAVRDPRYGMVKGELQMTDPGVPDKRLLVVETEFGGVLTRLKRETNTLGAVLRQAWDGGTLRVATKEPLVATNPHICLIAHITPSELREKLATGDISNGLANRFLWVLIRRVRSLSRPPALEGEVLCALAAKWRAVLEAARAAGRLVWSDEAGALWDDVYADLAPARESMVADLTARSAPIICRLAVLYALLDGVRVIGRAHLEAAVEVWGYAERCVDYLFGEAAGGKPGEVILKHMRRLPSHEMDTSDIYRLFSGRIAQHEVHDTMDELERLGLVTYRREPTKTKPRHIWKLVPERER